MEEFPAVSKQTKEDLEVLKSVSLIEGFYLAGGTGLAFLINHRESHDLDFFQEASFNSDQLVSSISQAGLFSLEKKEDETIRGVFNKTVLSFFHYPYPLLEKFENVSGVNIAR